MGQSCLLSVTIWLKNIAIVCSKNSFLRAPRVYLIEFHKFSIGTTCARKCSNIIQMTLLFRILCAAIIQMGRVRVIEVAFENEPSFQRGNYNVVLWVSERERNIHTVNERNIRNWCKMINQII